MLSTYHASRYVVPLREGGSMPAVVEAEDEASNPAGLYVTKFRGAGQGAKALVAELVVGALAHALDLPVPGLALIDVDAAFGRTERDPEIQDILRGSHGVNVGMRYLEGALNFEHAADPVDADLAARIVWLDAFVSNLDRTAHNTNLMMHDGRLWLIDHGAALYFHHDWSRVDTARAHDPFAPIADHVLLPMAGDLRVADDTLASKLMGTPVLEAVLKTVPDTLLMDAPAGVAPPFPTATDNRRAYLRYFEDRLAQRTFVERAIQTQREIQAQRETGQTPTRLEYRR